MSSVVSQRGWQASCPKVYAEDFWLLTQKKPPSFGFLKLATRVNHIADFEKVH
jgi:hypothetical protein